MSVENTIVICKPDLDTCLTGLILHGNCSATVTVVSGLASLQQLMDPEILCIECGGSGNVAYNNFDHHDPNQDLPPACHQAWEIRGCDPSLKRIVAYVCAVDEATGFSGSVAFPALSHIFSGMLLTVRGNQHQYAAGFAILQDVVSQRLDPFAQMPDLRKWRTYSERKENHRKQVVKDLKRTRVIFSRTGKKIGFFESTLIGGLQALYRQGCDIVVAYNSAFGESVICKYTIASQEYAVSRLLPELNSMEKGWGGRERIIGSPYTGSSLSMKQLVELVCESF